MRVVALRTPKLQMFDKDLQVYLFKHFEDVESDRMKCQRLYVYYSNNMFVSVVFVIEHR